MYCPSANPFHGVIPRCIPNNSPSNIAGTSLIAAKNAKNKGIWINATKHPETGLILYFW